MSEKLLRNELREVRNQLAAVVAERDALAVEGVALREAIDDIADVFETGTDGLLFTAVDNAVNLKVTHTAAAVRGFHAEGVEKFAKVLRVKGDDAFFDAIAEAQANAADAFAAELREASNDD